MLNWSLKHFSAVSVALPPTNIKTDSLIVIDSISQLINGYKAQSKIFVNDNNLIKTDTTALIKVSKLPNSQPLDWSHCRRNMSSIQTTYSRFYHTAIVYLLHPKSREKKMQWKMLKKIIIIIMWSCLPAAIWCLCLSQCKNKMIKLDELSTHFSSVAKVRLISYSSLAGFKLSFKNGAWFAWLQVWNRFSQLI